MSSSNKHAKCVRQFTISHQAWYAGVMNFKPGQEEVMIGMYHPEGGTTGEFAIRWKNIGGKSSAQLQVFHDAWSALLQFSDVLEKLGTLDDTRPTVKEVVAVLKACGVVDATQRENPNMEVGTTADVERVAQIYRATFQAFEGLRDIAREQGEDPTWAEYAQFGVMATPLSNVDADLSQKVLEFGHTLVVRREELERACRATRDESVYGKYSDELDVPSVVEELLHRCGRIEM
jgi:hypothetical protein